jgi:hypothetical protein
MRLIINRLLVNIWFGIIDCGLIGALVLEHCLNADTPNSPQDHPQNC